MYPVIVSDLDGTLLNDKQKISDRTRQVMQQLSKQGIQCVFATGRHYIDVEQIRAQLGIDMYLVTSNGASVHDPEGRQIICHEIATDFIAPLIEVGRKYSKIVTHIYTSDSWFIDKEQDIVRDFNQQSEFYYEIKKLCQVDKNSIQKIFFSVEKPEDLEPLAHELKENFGNNLSLTYSIPTFFEVMSKGVSKGMALNTVFNLIGINAEDVIAFGDGMNDIEMLKLVGKGVVMGDAGSGLRGKLPEHEIIGLSKDNAVAEYLADLYRV